MQSFYSLDDFRLSTKQKRQKNTFIHSEKQSKDNWIEKHKYGY